MFVSNFCCSTLYLWNLSMVLPYSVISIFMYYFVAWIYHKLFIHSIAGEYLGLNYSKQHCHGYDHISLMDIFYAFLLTEPGSRVTGSWKIHTFIFSILDRRPVPRAGHHSTFYQQNRSHVLSRPLHHQPFNFITLAITEFTFLNDDVEYLIY